MLLEKLGNVKVGDDVLIWLPNGDGKFSTRSAWECIRSHRPSQSWIKWIWHPFLPKKMSILMWKALNGCLSVDDRMQRVGINIVSKCDYRALGAYED